MEELRNRQVKQLAQAQKASRTEFAFERKAWLQSLFKQCLLNGLNKIKKFKNK